jgi:hypothetical protein
MLANGTDELRGQIGRARGLLAASGGAIAEDAEPSLPGDDLSALGVDLLVS